jgi:hypothetical protein
MSDTNTHGESVAECVARLSRKDMKSVANRMSLHTQIIVVDGIVDRFDALGETRMADFYREVATQLRALLP